ncbi:hypothetical protein ABKN59_009858 [Abortiporus biennis]
MKVNTRVRTVSRWVLEENLGIASFIYVFCAMLTDSTLHAWGIVCRRSNLAEKTMHFIAVMHALKFGQMLIDPAFQGRPMKGRPSLLFIVASEARTVQSQYRMGLENYRRDGSRGRRVQNQQTL